MPHQRCISCGVVSYVTSGSGGAACPECGVPWPGWVDETIGNAGPQWRLGALLRMTRDLLDADVALLSEIRDGREIARVAAGEWPGIGSLEGVSAPVGDTFCQRMLEGLIGNVIADAATDSRVSDLAMARRLGIGAWMGVPIELSDAELYVLCCLAREARPSIGAREVQLLTGLAASVRAELESTAPA